MLLVLNSIWLVLLMPMSPSNTKANYKLALGLVSILISMSASNTKTQ